MPPQRRYWLLKTEPHGWSWDDHRANGGATVWDGVRNRQALNNLKSMRRRDRCFFYHSGASDRRIVAVVEVTKPWYSTASPEEGAVDVGTVGELRRPVDLKDIKALGEEMKGFALLKQPRLSVVPVPPEIWDRICEMGGGVEEETEGPPSPASPEREEGRRGDGN